MRRIDCLAFSALVAACSAPGSLVVPVPELVVSLEHAHPSATPRGDSPGPSPHAMRRQSANLEDLDLGPPRIQLYRQGYVAVNFLDEFVRSGGSSFPGAGNDLDRWPVVGGGGQWVLGGERIDLGLEALIAFGARANAGAFIIGGGGALIAIDLDFLVVDIYGGPFISSLLGERIRAFAGAGPLIQFAQYGQSDPSNTVPSESGSGFGVGYYARVGAEVRVRAGTFIGFGARWTDSEVDLSNGLGDVDIQGVELFVSVTEY